MSFTIVIGHCFGLSVFAVFNHSLDNTVIIIFLRRSREKSFSEVSFNDYLTSWIKYTAGAIKFIVFVGAFGLKDAVFKIGTDNAQLFSF
jgi:hypothetical protein